MWKKHYICGYKTIKMTNTYTGHFCHAPFGQPTLDPPHISGNLVNLSTTNIE